MSGTIPAGTGWIPDGMITTGTGMKMCLPGTGHPWMRGTGSITEFPGLALLGLAAMGDSRL